MADAAEAAEDEPRASMIAAPRLATVGMKSFSSQAWSPTSSAALRPPTSAWNRSGYWVAEWLPQIVIFLMSVTAAPVFGGELRDRAVVVEAGQRGEPLARDVGGVGHRDEGVGVGRVAGDADATSSAATALRALPWAVKIAPLADEQVAALHAGAARAGADEQGEVDAVEDLLGVGSRSRRRRGAGTRSRRAP